MPIVSAKRQITLPVERRKEAGIGAGDMYESFIDNNGHITIIKKQSGSAFGLLSGTKVDERFTDEQSMQSSLAK